MADDLKNRGTPDRDRISLDEDHEVQYWTKTLGFPVRSWSARYDRSATQPMPSGAP